MNRRIALAWGLCMILASRAQAREPAEHPLPPGEWMESAEAALEASAKSGKLVILDFTFDT